MRIGICDDSIEECVALAKAIRKSPLGDTSPHIYTSAEQVLSDTDPPELLFLDVQLAGMDGLAAAHVIRDRGLDMEIVFISGHPEYVFDAFDVEARGFLVKPFDDAKIETILKKAHERAGMADEERRFVFSKRGIHRSVRLRDIIYAEVFNRKIVLHTVSGIREYYGKLTELEEQVGEDFFRTHRAYLVNLRYVDSYDAHTVWLAGHEVLMAKRNYRPFVSAYMDYVRRMRGCV